MSERKRLLAKAETRKLAGKIALNDRTPMPEYRWDGEWHWLVAQCQCLTWRHRKGCPAMGLGRGPNAKHPCPTCGAVLEVLGALQCPQCLEARDVCVEKRAELVRQYMQQGQSSFLSSV